MKDRGWQPQIIIILLNTRYTQHGFNSIFNTGMGMQLKNKVVFSELSFCSEASSYNYGKSMSFGIQPLKPYKREYCHPLLIDTKWSSQLSQHQVKVRWGLLHTIRINGFPCLVLLVGWIYPFINMPFTITKYVAEA